MLGKACDDESSTAEISLHEVIKPHTRNGARHDGLRVQPSDLQKWLENPANVTSSVYFGSPGGMKPFLSILAMDYVDIPLGESVALERPHDMTPAEQVYEIEMDAFWSIIKQGGYDCAVFCFYEAPKFVHISISWQDKAGQAESLVDKLQKMGELQAKRASRINDRADRCDHKRP